MKILKNWAAGAFSMCALLLGSAASASSVSFTAVPPPSYTLTVTTAGAESPGSYSQTYASGTTVTLTANATPGYEFKSWSGACGGNVPSCTVPMNAAKSVTASFARTVYPLTVTLTGAGKVSSTPAGIDCGATCSAGFSSGTNVVLSATPASGYVFSGWGGNCSGVLACTVPMNAAANVTALFQSGPAVTIKWHAPSTMADGSALAGLTGYKVYASQTRYDLAPALVATVADPGAVSATVAGLKAGVWYFWVSATSANAESEMQYTSSATVSVPSN